MSRGLLFVHCCQVVTYGYSRSEEKRGGGAQDNIHGFMALSLMSRTLSSRV